MSDQIHPVMHAAENYGPFAHPISYQQLIKRIPQSLVILDSTFRVVFLNQAMEVLTGYRQEEVVGLPCRFIIRSSLCGLKCPLKSMDKHSEPVVLEGDILNKQRQKVPVRLTCFPLLDVQGNHVGWQECYDDLRTDRDAAEKEARAFGLGPLVGNSPAMEKVFSLSSAIAGTDSSVLITGETGTGKDVLAEVIHQKSSRHKGPFVKVNCGALPETLLESELFGHQKGAFTGATENKPGRIKLAHNGTLFLTEIGDLPQLLQVKLLSFLDDQVIYPLGSTKGVQVNVRIIAATNQDLKTMVREGRFREDLYYRLQVVQIQLPALREREADVLILMEYFLRKYRQAFQKNVHGLTKDCQELILAYPFPGNVRELKNVIEFAVNICEGKEIAARHLPGYLQEAAAGQQDFSEGVNKNLVEKTKVLSGSHLETWAGTEREMIRQALLATRGKKQKAAEQLGWARSTLWRKMKQYGLES
jgi:PAS domain S-box-containing protein